MLKFLCIVFLISLLSIKAEASDPYCVRNESIIIRTPVMKTRQVIKKPTGFFKILKKTTVYSENYQDFEEHIKMKLVRICCDGYEMSHFNICEPICKNGCPKNAKCIEPNLCQCQSGYMLEVSSKDGNNYCEPVCSGGCPPNARCAEPEICECERGYHIVDSQCVPRCTSGCPFGGSCIGPNECNCLEGYKPESGSCAPICTSGDGCQNGRCVDLEECVCNPGFDMNPDSKICEKACQNGICNIDHDSAEEYGTTVPTSSESFEEYGSTEIGFELDENEKIYLSSSGTTSTVCPPNYVFYDDLCRPQVFASNETNCKYKPCVEHAICQNNGTCTCEEGYIWYIPEAAKNFDTKDEIRALCLTQSEINKFIQADRSSEIDSEDEINWLSGSFIALGVLCIALALCFLVVKMLRQRNRKMIVEVKNDLYCAYDSKNSKDVPLVL